MLLIITFLYDTSMVMLNKKIVPYTLILVSFPYSCAFQFRPQIDY